MPIFNKFIEVSLNPDAIDKAVDHAHKRTDNIVRQFVPRNAPLVHLESNFVGALGEIAVRQFLNLGDDLDDNYEDGQVDEGDIVYSGLIYDVKTDAIPTTFYRRLYTGELEPYETYGCRVFTAKHLHHLRKYTGGLIFTAVEIPNDSRNNQIEGEIRDVILRNNRVLIIGYVEQDFVTLNPPSWDSPKDPRTGSCHRYNSPNYVFHHSKPAVTGSTILKSLRDL